MVSDHGNRFKPCRCHPNAAHPHHFEPDLCCKHCGTLWYENQTDSGVSCTRQEESHE